MADGGNSGDGGSSAQPIIDRELEIAKMYQDTFKHMTTFCSGAIVLTASVVSALIPNPEYGNLLGFCLFFFAGGAATAMLGLKRNIDILEAGADASDKKLNSQRLLKSSVFSGYLGVLVFAFFAAVNLS